MSTCELAEPSEQAAPGPTRRKRMFLSTGAEAVENAVKISRRYTGSERLSSRFPGAFHGRTMMGMALTGKVVPYKVGFGPFPAEVFHLPFPIELPRRLRRGFARGARQAVQGRTSSRHASPR